MIGRPGLLDLLEGKSKDVQQDALAWFAVARAADWPDFAALRGRFPDAGLVNGLLVFSIRHNRHRLIVYPVFSRRKLYVRALLTHREYETKDWKNQWP